jgi:hypothetical protein
MLWGVAGILAEMYILLVLIENGNLDTWENIYCLPPGHGHTPEALPQIALGYYIWKILGFYDYSLRICARHQIPIYDRIRQCADISLAWCVVMAGSSLGAVVMFGDILCSTCIYFYSADDNFKSESMVSTIKISHYGHFAVGVIITCLSLYQTFIHQEGCASHAAYEVWIGGLLILYMVLFQYLKFEALHTLDKRVYYLD